MRHKLYWGAGLLILLLIGATVFITLRDRAEIRQLKASLAETQKLKHPLNTDQHLAYSDEKPPDEAGFEWIRHGDHWDKIPIAQENDNQDNVSNNGIWYPPEELAMSDEERRKLYLEREAKREARFAAEEAKNAKIYQQKLAEYEILKKQHGILEKIAALNRQIGGDDISADDFESNEQFYKWVDQRWELRRQQRLLTAEFNSLTEENGSDD